jgi:type IV secretion system protein VirD4
MECSIMTERMFGQIYYGLMAILAAALLPIVLHLVMGFDVGDSRWWIWLWRYYQSQETLPPTLMWTGGAWLLLTTLAFGLCPFSLAPVHYGKARWAKGRFTLWRLGLTAKQGIVLGMKGGRLLICDKPLSCLLLAPAGTGKTRGTIVPTVLAYGGSIITHDPKGEVYDATAAHRISHGRVLRFECSAPHRSVCWNPLSPGNLPDDRGGRGNAVDRLCAVAIPGDPSSFWISSPRLALAAITLFLVYEAERMAGREASFSGALSWLGKAMSDAANASAEDPVAMHFERAAGTAEIERYPERVATGLRLVAQMNYKTRADVLGTINSALGIFLNESVAAVTSRSDFTLKELRGTGGMPVSLYIVVPQNDMAAFAPVTGMLIEMASMELLSKRPGKGESSVLFVLDEARFLPPLDAISDGPSIGRGYGVHYLICAQDYGQLRLVYGPNKVDNIITNTAYKIVLAQNHVETAEFVSRTVGNWTRRRESLARQFSWAAPANVRSSVSEQFEGSPLVPAQDILSLPHGRQIIMVQNRLHTPVMARSPFYDKVRLFRRRSGKKVLPK